MLIYLDAPLGGEKVVLIFPASTNRGNVETATTCKDDENDERDTFMILPHLGYEEDGVSRKSNVGTEFHHYGNLPSKCQSRAFHWRSWRSSTRAFARLLQ